MVDRDTCLPTERFPILDAWILRGTAARDMYLCAIYIPQRVHPPTGGAPMATTHARIFISGNSQAIRVPKSLAYPPHVHDLVVRRDGDRLIF